jgi:hypothetical protein
VILLEDKDTRERIKTLLSSSGKPIGIGNPKLISITELSNLITMQEKLVSIGDSITEGLRATVKKRAHD